MTWKKQFSIRFETEATLTVDEIWPDGDAPENPTAEDVRAVFLESCRNDVLRGLEDWDLVDRYDDIQLDVIELGTPKRYYGHPWYALKTMPPRDSVEAWENEGGR